MHIIYVFCLFIFSFIILIVYNSWLISIGETKAALVGLLLGCISIVLGNIVAILIHKK